MFNISSFLDKFSKNIKSAELYNERIMETIEKYTQIKIPKNEIEIKDCVVFIKSSPAIKNKLFIYKNKILEEINSTVDVKIVDIK